MVDVWVKISIFHSFLIKLVGAKSLDFDYSLDWTLHLKVMTMTTVISGSPAKSHDYDYSHDYSHDWQ